MRLILLVALSVCALASAAPQFTYNTEFQSDTAFTAFAQYVQRFGKRYANVQEYIERFGHFQESLKRISERNTNGRNVFGLTKFSDLSPAEFKQGYLGFDPKLKAKQPKAKIATPRLSANVTAFDWRDKNAITAVKDQGQCGSCWAFSATEEIESCWFLAGNDLVELAPQQITSCDTTDSGCGGGWTTSAYQYVESAGGMDTESDYPYVSGTEGDQPCDDPLPGTPVATITDFSYAIPPCQDECTNQDEQTMAGVLSSVAPLSVCVYAESWQDYSGGILTDNCPSAYDELDHCVQAVGFDQSGDTPYWIVRNSWAEDWGESGYIRVALGSNLCGIGDLATYVNI